MNPLLKKDVLALLRLQRISLLLGAFVVMLGLLVLATWPQQGLMPLANRGQDNLLLSLIFGQLVVLILTVPGVAAVQLTEEKEANTLEMLYATRLSPLSIILAKLGSTVCFPALLLLAGLPFVALLNLRGDVDVRQLGAAYGVLILAAVLLAVLCLAVSASCKTSSTALVVGYSVALCFCGLVLVPALIMLDTADPATATTLHYLRSLSPVAAAMSILRPEFNDFGGALRVNPPAWKIFTVFAAGVIAVSALLVARRLARPPTDVETRGGIDDTNVRSVGRRMMFLIDDKKRRKPVGNFNPVMGKERKTNQLRSGRWMIRIFYGTLLLSLSLALMALYGGTEYGDTLAYVATIIVALQFGVIALVTPSLASPVISSETEAGTFEMLRMTPLGGGKIFWGKLLPAVLPSLLPLLAILPAWVVVGFLNPDYLWYALALLPIAVVALLFCLTLSLACSSLCSSSARATVIAYTLVAVVFVLPMVAWWLAGALLSDGVSRTLAVVSPLVVALDVRPGQTGNPLTRGGTTLHLCIIGGGSLLCLLIARLKLNTLLRQG